MCPQESQVFVECFVPCFYQKNFTKITRARKIDSVDSCPRNWIFLIFPLFLVPTRTPLSFSLRPRFSYHSPYRVFHLSPNLIFLISVPSFLVPPATRSDRILYIRCFRQRSFLLEIVDNFCESFIRFEQKGNLQHSGVSFEANRYKLDVKSLTRIE